MPEDAEGEVGYKAGITGEKIIPFGEITYKAAGTYTYTITENTDDYTEEKGWKVSDNPITVTVRVTDNGDGTLSATVTGGVIKNEYNAEVTVDPKDTKTKFGEKNLAKTTEDGEGHEFSFTLAAVGTAPMPEKAEDAKGTVSYDAAETGVKTIPFGKITYKAAGTYEYTITEETETYTAEKGWTVTNSPLTVTVEVTDNGDGTLSAAVTGGVITNEYNAKEVTVDPTDTTTLFGQKNLILVKGDGEAYDFSFTLKAETEGAPMPESAEATVSYAAKEDGTKTIPFGKITYTKVGEYEYSISETVGEYTEELGWTITDNDTKVKVTVTDGGEGQLLAAVSGTETITNSYTQVTIDVTVRKEWDDADNQDGKRPADLKVVLSADGTAVNYVTLSKNNNWTGTVTGVPKYKKGKEITYTWTEPEVAGYTGEKPATEGYVTVLTNTHTPETVDLTVKKVWNDNNAARRPENLTVYLKKDSTVLQQITLNAANSWTATVTGLPKYEAGTEIKYSWDEAAVTGYTLVSNTTEGQVTTLTNRRTGGGPTRYRLTVLYRYLDGSTAAPTVTEMHSQGDHYNVVSPVIPGYTANIKIVQGTMPNHDVTVIVLYIPGDDLVEIPDYETPLGLGNVSLNIGDCYE